MGKIKPNFLSAAPLDKALPIRANSRICRGANYLYVITSCFSNVVTGMIKVFSFDVYALLDLGVSISFLNPYMDMNFVVLHEQLLKR